MNEKSSNKSQDLAFVCPQCKSRGSLTLHTFDGYLVFRCRSLSYFSPTNSYCSELVYSYIWLCTDPIEWKERAVKKYNKRLGIAENAF